MGKVAKYKQIPLNELKEIVKNNKSYAGVLKELGYNPNGSGSQAGLIEYLKENNINTSHFTGQGWNKGNYDYSRFRYGVAIKPNRLKDALVSLRSAKCENCGLTEWNNELIPLEVHHKDGDHLNNELDNLQLLCPNCHALTENWRGRNISKAKTEIVPEEKFVEALRNSSSIRQALLSLGLTGAGANYNRAYELIAKYNIKK